MALPTEKPVEDQTRQNVESHLLSQMENMRVAIQTIKPDDRSQLDRYYAVFLTDYEKLLAYWQTWIVNRGL